VKRKKPRLDAEFWRRDAENRRWMAERVAQIEAELEAREAPRGKDPERRVS
jgi:hypothetical protein